MRQKRETLSQPPILESKFLCPARLTLVKSLPTPTMDDQRTEAESHFFTNNGRREELCQPHITTHHANTHRQLHYTSKQHSNSHCQSSGPLLLGHCRGRHAATRHNDFLLTQLFLLNHRYGTKQWPNTSHKHSTTRNQGRRSRLL